MIENKKQFKSFCNQRLKELGMNYPKDLMAFVYINAEFVWEEYLRYDKDVNKMAVEKYGLIDDGTFDSKQWHIALFGIVLLETNFEIDKKLQAKNN